MTGRRRPRGLTPEETEMWQRVTQSIRKAGLERPATPDEPSEPPKTRNPTPRGQPLPMAAPERGNSASASQLDGKLDARLKRGRLEPERVLDLHGLTAARAEAILKLFVERCRAEDVRLVLVITGKGRDHSDARDVIPPRKGILRDHLPVWVSAMGSAVVKMAGAHPRHGGSGAFYLYLRRRRAARLSGSKPDRQERR